MSSFSMEATILLGCKLPNELHCVKYRSSAFVAASVTQSRTGESKVMFNAFQVRIVSVALSDNHSLVLILILVCYLSFLQNFWTPDCMSDV